MLDKDLKTCDKQRLQLIVCEVTKKKMFYKQWHKL